MQAAPSDPRPIGKMLDVLVDTVTAAQASGERLADLLGVVAVSRGAATQHGVQMGAEPPDRLADGADGRRGNLGCRLGGVLNLGKQHGGDHRDSSVRFVMPSSDAISPANSMLNARRGRSGCCSLRAARMRRNLVISTAMSSSVPASVAANMTGRGCAGSSTHTHSLSSSTNAVMEVASRTCTTIGSVPSISRSSLFLNGTSPIRVRSSFVADTNVLGTSWPYAGIGVAMVITVPARAGGSDPHLR
jgi:hypothetical protein